MSTRRARRVTVATSIPSRTAGICALALFSILSSKVAPPRTPSLFQTSSTATKDDLPRRLKDAVEARGSGDPIRIAHASARVLSLALVQMAKIRLDARDFAQAFYLCRQSLEFEDADQTRVEMAIVGLYARKTDDAVEQASAAAKLNPNNSLAWTIKGEALIQAGDYRGAVESLQRALEIRRDTESLYAVGMAYLAVEDPQKAREAFSEVLTRAGDAAWSRILIGRAYEEQKFSREAIEEYKAALRLDPRAPNAHYQWAHALLRANDWSPIPEVRYQLIEELKLNPRHFLSNYLLGIFESIERNYVASDRLLKVASGLDPSLPEIWMYLGLNANARGEKQAAERFFRKAVALREHGSDPRGHLSVRRAYSALGRLLVLSGRNAEGRKLLKTAQEMQLADLADRREKVAGIKSEEGAGVAGAVSDLSEADRRWLRTFGPADPAGDFSGSALASSDGEKAPPPSDRPAVAQLRATLGASFNDLATAEALQQQFELALKHYRLAGTWDPNIPGLTRNLGLAYFYAGQPADAIPVLERVVARTSSDVQMKVILARCYFSGKNYRKTAQLVDSISAQVEKDAQINFIWAEALAELGRSREAVLALNRAEKADSGSDVQFLLDRARLWNKLDNRARANRCFRAVLSLDPANPIARQALAISDSGIAERK